jgi:hypothetical protein
MVPPDQGTIGADRARLAITMTILRWKRSQRAVEWCNCSRESKIPKTFQCSLGIHDIHGMELKNGIISSRKPFVHRSPSFQCPNFPKEPMKRFQDRIYLHGDPKDVDFTTKQWGEINF